LLEVGSNVGFIVGLMFSCLDNQSKKWDASHLQHGYHMVWSNLGSKHGKGIHVGVATILKQKIRKEQL